jgi:predicted transcriptional regulator of viral defense system
MKASDAYARLEQLGRPVITTGEAADLWHMEPVASSQMLGRLSRPGLVQRLRAGIWKIGPTAVSADVVLPVLTRPYPSYISLWSALFDHGMLDQVPRSVYAASLARPQAVQTSVGEYRAHHVHPGPALGRSRPVLSSSFDHRAQFDAYPQHRRAVRRVPQPSVT